jgi:hypothetical protein
MKAEALAFCTSYKDDGTHLGMLARLALDAEAKVQAALLGVAIERTVQGVFYPTNLGHQDPKVFEALQAARREGKGGPFESAEEALEAAVAALRARGLLADVPEVT